MGEELRGMIRDARVISLIFLKRGERVGKKAANREAQGLEYTTATMESSQANSLCLACGEGNQNLFLVGDLQ